MCSLEPFKIDLKSLTDETATLAWDVNDSFFQALDESELQSGSLHVSGSIRKASGFFELLLHAEGMVIVSCDRCLDPMEQPIAADNRIVVRLGSPASNDDDVVTVDEDEGILDTSWLVYETIALAIPIQHVHAPGKCNTAMTQALEKLSADRSGDEESTEAVDPRWEKLRGLLGPEH